jgi:hypothetical protein
VIAIDIVKHSFSTFLKENSNFLIFNLSHLVWFLAPNTTFNNISVISWRSVSLMEKTGVPGANH